MTNTEKTALADTEPAYRKIRNGQASGVLFEWADTMVGDRPAMLRWAHRIVRIILICFRETKENLLTLRAGYLTYALLLSMVPLLAMSTAVVKGLGGGNQLRGVVYAYIDSLEQLSPDQGSQQGQESGSGSSPDSGAEGSADLTTHLRSAADKMFDYVERTNFATLGTFGMVGIFFSVIMVLGQIEKSLNIIWKVSDGRRLLRKIADYISLMILLPISINVALAAGTTLESQALSVHLDKFLPIIWLQAILLKGVPVLFLSATLYVIYIFFPNTRTGGIPTLIGAVIAGSCWFITQNFYISAQVGVAKYNAIYGSFATIPLFLIWVWVAWLFVLIGAQIAYAIQKEPNYHFSARVYEPAQQLSAALDVCRTMAARFNAGEKTRSEDLIEENHVYPPDLVEKAIEALVGAGLLHHSLETGELVPAVPPEKIAAKTIVETIMGVDTPQTFGGERAALAVAGAAREMADARET
jgi:membrane protein